MKPENSPDDPLVRKVAFARRDKLHLGVEVLRLESLLRPPFKRETTMPARVCFHTLLLVEAGTSSHHVDFVRKPVGPGHLLIAPQGCVQAFDKERVIKGYLVLFTADFLERCCLAVSRLAECSHALLRSSVHLNLGNESLAQVRHGMESLASVTSTVSAGRFAGEAIASAFSLLVFTLTDLPETTYATGAHSPHDPLVLRFQDLMEARFRQSHQATSYAEALNVSLRTLDRRILAELGQTARQAIAARLVLEAKRMLAARDVPVKSIAFHLGFSEPQNFTRFFKAQAGLSPEAFRVSLDR